MTPEDLQNRIDDLPFDVSKYRVCINKGRYGLSPISTIAIQEAVIKDGKAEWAVVVS
tara:strand:- start:1856 stop:2026 length:171 start_codon:yes stop_codon:yes gene_type:complete